MLYKSHLFTALLLGLFCINQSCTKHPNPTPIGYFNIIVNGTPIKMGTSTTKYGGEITITASELTHLPNKYLVLCIVATGKGTHILNATTSLTQSSGGFSVNNFTENSATYLERQNSNDFIEYSTDSSHTGILTITKFDVNTKQLSGTFNFKAIKIVPPDSTTVNVNGSFKDVVWR